MSRRSIGRGLGLALLAIALAVAGFVAYRRGTGPRGPGVIALPGPGSDTYSKMVAAFYSGIAALDVDARDRARDNLGLATRLVPEEPAAWANLGLYWIRLDDFDAAARELERARALAPESAPIEGLLALLESRRGQFAEAISHLRRAIELDPADLKARFALSKEVERQGEPEAEAEVLRLLRDIQERRPDSLVVLLEQARLAAKRGDAEVLRDSVERLGRLSPEWPQRAKDLYKTLQEAVGSDIRLASPRVAFLRNLLVRTPAYGKDLASLETPIGVVGEPIPGFLRLATPSRTASPPDRALRFAVEPAGKDGPARLGAVLAVSLDGAATPALFVSDGREVRRADGSGSALPFPGGPSSKATSRGILAADLDSDYRMDLVLAGAGGLKIYRQKEDGTFADVTGATGLEASVFGLDAVAAWAADIEMDGDLDVVVAARQGRALVLRNNGDGGFSPADPFEGVADLRDFAWADFDRDGDPDAALLNAEGKLLIFSNERAGRFRARPAPEGLGAITALSVADVDRDGGFDLLAIRSGGVVTRVSDRDGGQGWDVGELVRGRADLGADARLFAADLDNNGSEDLLASGASGAWIALGDESGAYRPLEVSVGLQVLAVDDLNGDGMLDLAGLSGEGKAVRAVARGSKGYRWQVLRPRGAKTFGDGRINSFGIGGEVEVRAGLLVQKQIIASPRVHFGLGDRPTVDVTRIVWPNGTVQGEFDTKADQVLAAEQRLKGSCPFLYAFDGREVRFVTDFIWRSPLGLRINAQDTAGVSQTEDWVKIAGNQLAPMDGQYDIRVTAELWETHYWDHVSLMVVDHPEGSEVFVDERFARTPPRLAVHPTGPLIPLASALDDAGRDVSEVVRSRDGRHLDTFGRGFYQGVTRDHWVEGELGSDVPPDRPLVLVAHGWIHPTDSSINLALGQGHHEPPKGLSLEVATPDGGWAVARPDLGFPAGKNKTILVDLEGVFPPGAPRRFRLRTNLEVYWDSLAVAVAEPETPLKTARLAPASAELRHRGYSRITREDEGSPEWPDYNTLTGTAQRWLDLVGFYTRFGDVRELLTSVDDRYVIANAGDELALRFDAPTGPPAGWTRDFVLIGDGWNKDGDFNTAYSKTVTPLPSHRSSGYEGPSEPLEDDPIYREHPRDWIDYHTRFITPRDFRDGLRPRAGSGPPRGSESAR